MKKKLSALLIVVCLLCLCLTACGGVPTTKKLSLDDYAVTLSTAQEKGYIAGGGSEKTGHVDLGDASDINFIPAEGTGAKAVVYSSGEASNRTFNLFNIKSNSTVLSGYRNIQQFNNYSVACSSSDNTLTVRALDGTELLSSNNWTSFPQQDNVHGTTVAGYDVQFKITAQTAERNVTVYCYLNDMGYARAIPQSEIDAAGNVTTVLVSNGAVTARDEVPLKEFKGFDYKSYTENDGFMSSYYLAYVDNNGGRTYYFDRRGDGTMSVLTVPSNAQGVMYADGKVIYTTMTALPYTAEKGYNFVKTSQSDFTKTQKYEYKTYSFDIEKGKTKELNLGYVILDAVPQFNRNSGRYDAFAISAIRMKDGVATFATEADLETFIVDKNGKVGFDFTSLKININMPVIKLDSDRYLVANSAGVAFILNAKGETVANLGSGATSNNGGFSYVYNVSESNKLIVLGNGEYGSDARYAAVDYDGKMKLDYKYTSLDFYGNKACATVDGIKGLRIVNPDNEKGQGLKSAVGMGDGENIVTGGTEKGLVITQTASGSDRTVRIKNYSGTEIASFSVSSNIYSVSFQNLIDGAVRLTVYTSSSTRNFIVK